jgi:DNA-binding HxlR family transcriptional regulator
MKSSRTEKDDVARRILLDQLADKWSILILGELCDGPVRFNEIKRCVFGLSQKTLTQCLRRLERNGLVTRRVLMSGPLGVEYALTPLGRSLTAPFEALFAWAEDHMSEMLDAQADFDQRAS